MASLVERAIQKEVATILEEETEAAVKQAEERTRRRIKELTVRVSAEILQRFEMVQRDNVLTIKVKFNEDKK